MRKRGRPTGCSLAGGSLPASQFPRSGQLKTRLIGVDRPLSSIFKTCSTISALVSHLVRDRRRSTSSASGAQQYERSTISCSLKVRERRTWYSVQTQARMYIVATWSSIPRSKSAVFQPLLAGIRHAQYVSLILRTFRVIAVLRPIGYSHQIASLVAGMLYTVPRPTLAKVGHPFPVASDQFLSYRYRLDTKLWDAMFKWHQDRSKH